jgi:hypothetical protein
MKNLKLVIIIILVIIVIGIFLQFTKKPKDTNQNPAITPPVETLVPTVTSTPSSQYSDEVRAKVRSEFINNCHTQGKYEISDCTCAADYLSKNYSDADLAKMYLEYHSSKKIPSAIETAANKCLAE